MPKFESMHGFDGMNWSADEPAGGASDNSGELKPASNVDLQLMPENQDQAEKVQLLFDEMNTYVARRQIDPTTPIKAPSEAIADYLRRLPDPADAKRLERLEQWCADDIFHEAYTEWVSKIAAYEVLPSVVEIQAVTMHMKHYYQDLTSSPVARREEVDSVLSAGFYVDSKPNAAEIIFRLGQAMNLDRSEWAGILDKMLSEEHGPFRNDKGWLTMPGIAKISTLSVLAGFDPIHPTDSGIVQPD